MKDFLMWFRENNKVYDTWHFLNSNFVFPLLLPSCLMKFMTEVFRITLIKNCFLLKKFPGGGNRGGQWDFRGGLGHLLDMPLVLTPLELLEGSLCSSRHLGGPPKIFTLKKLLIKQIFISILQILFLYIFIMKLKKKKNCRYACSWLKTT